MFLNVYQPRLTDAQRFEVNTDGWDAHAAYLNATDLGVTDYETDIVPALGYYCHAWTVEGASMDAIFETLNVNHGAADKMHPGARSMSVGDVAMNWDATVAYICGPMGWIKMTQQQAREFQCTVPTVMRAA